jgi:hypothetical protein
MGNSQRPAAKLIAQMRFGARSVRLIVLPTAVAADILTGDQIGVW